MPAARLGRRLTMFPRLNSRRRRVAVGCGFVLVVFGCWCGLIARDVLALKADFDQLQADLAAIGDGQIDLESVGAHAVALGVDLASVRSTGAPLLAVAPHLGWLPGIGYDLQATPALIDAAIDLSEAGQIAIDALESVWPPHSANSRPALAVMAQELAGLTPRIAGARDAVERAARRLESIDVGKLSPSIGRQVQRIASRLPLLRSGLDLTDLAPGLLGFDRPRTYIILIQNNDELRPTGGFISAVARVTLDRGEMVELDVRDSYQVDDYPHNPYDLPPQPLLDFMGSELWLFRDANWSPDFPTSARKAAELYTYGLGKSVDGVIGLNQQTVMGVVGTLGPIEVEPGGPRVDASNLIEYMRASWSPPPDVVDVGAWVASRKDFIGTLMNAVLIRLQTSPDAMNWIDVGRAVFDALKSRELLIWIDDPAVATLLADLGWDGSVRQVAGDYWMLVDSNVGFNKANAAVESSIAYTVTLQPDGSAEADLAILYRHTGTLAEGCPFHLDYSQAPSYETLIQSCYWDYVRLLAPPGAQLQAATSHPVPADYLVVGRPFDGSTRVDAELGKTIFGTLFVLERGQSIKVVMSYRAPSVAAWTADGGRYTLTVQKQSGVKARPVTVTLLWPDGYALVRASLPVAQAEAQSASFALDLTTDQTLSVTWARE